jgi:tubulin alpha
MVDNDALCSLCRGRLDIEGWTYTNLSGLMERVNSSLPASLRFDGTVSVDFTTFNENGVRNTRIQWAICPLRVGDQSRRGVSRAFSVAEINKALIAPANISKVPLAARQAHGVHAAMPRRDRPGGRRHGVLMIESKTTVKFIDWYPADFNVCISYQSPAVVPSGYLAKVQRAVCMVPNATAIPEAGSRLDDKLKFMYAKCTFIHCYVGEGMKETN